MEYTAIIEHTSDGWYIGHCAEVPNAHTQGLTIEEVVENLKEAIELILSCEREISEKHTIVINYDNDKVTSVPRHADVNDKLILSLCKDLGIPKIQSH